MFFSLYRELGESGTIGQTLCSVSIGAGRSGGIGERLSRSRPARTDYFPFAKYSSYSLPTLIAK